MTPWYLQVGVKAVTHEVIDFDQAWDIAFQQYTYINYTNIQIIRISEH